MTVEPIMGLGPCPAAFAKNLVTELALGGTTIDIPSALQPAYILVLLLSSFVWKWVSICSRSAIYSTF